MSSKPKQIDTSLRQFIKDLGYISGGAALRQLPHGCNPLRRIKSKR